MFHIPHKTSLITAFLTSTICVACTNEGIGHDSDGDGLSDRQEAVFGTDPHLADSDGDTILDGIDPDPLTPALVQIEIHTVSIQTRESDFTAQIRISVRDHNERWTDAVPIAASASAGTLSPIESIGTGLYQTFLTAPLKTPVVLTFSTVNTAGQPDGRASESIRISPDQDSTQNSEPLPVLSDLISEDSVTLEVPGLNPGKYAAAGPMDGELWVMSIDGQTLDWSDADLKPYPKAYVQVDFQDGTSIHGTTNDAGWIHFKDERLKKPAHVTVGAKNARYFTWMNADARVVSAGIHHRDITQADAQTQGGSIHGVVRGFNGEYGGPAFPSEYANPFGTFNVAIVNVGIRNFPMSSMNSGSILLPPDGSNQSYLDIPPNFVLANLNSPDKSKYKLNRLVPGKYIVFALAGTGSNVTAALQNPYKLHFVPYALGISEFEVKAGQDIQVDIPLTIDLQNDQNRRAKLYFGQFPQDPRDKTPLPMGLVLPVLDTGKGFIYADVNADYNADDYRNPMVLSFPASGHKTLTDLGLSANPMIVGIAGRPGIKGFDQPGISTSIIHPQSDIAGDFSTSYMNSSQQWAPLPEFDLPAPPKDPLDFDSVGGNLNPDRRIRWKSTENADFTVLRFNYLTPPVHNPLIGTDIGAAQSHALWEIYVPSPIQEIVLPDLDTSAPDYPVLVNYEPTQPGDAYTYDSDTVELEINAHYMGEKTFQYTSDFLVSDSNLNTRAVSQDSYLIHVGK